MHVLPNITSLVTKLYQKLDHFWSKLMILATMRQLYVTLWNFEPVFCYEHHEVIVEAL